MNYVVFLIKNKYGLCCLYKKIMDYVEFFIKKNMVYVEYFIIIFL